MYNNCLVKKAHLSFVLENQIKVSWNIKSSPEFCLGKVKVKAQTTQHIRESSLTEFILDLRKMDTFSEEAVVKIASAVFMLCWKQKFS